MIRQHGLICSQPVYHDHKLLQPSQRCMTDAINPALCVASSCTFIIERYVVWSRLALTLPNVESRTFSGIIVALPVA
jgi:hypothetical protein